MTLKGNLNGRNKAGGITGHITELLQPTSMALASNQTYRTRGQKENLRNGTTQLQSTCL